MADWLFEDDLATAELGRSALVGAPIGLAGREPIPDKPVAVLLHDLVVHNNKKWVDFFGGADIRIDVLVVQGNVLEDGAHSFYTPSTIHFPDVRDHQSLPIDEHGLLAYFGWPKHFIDLSVMISRDVKGSDDLVTLLQNETTKPDFQGAASAVLQLVVAGPSALVVRSALGAASQLAALAYRVVRQACGTTIGMYRGNRLAQPHNFGIGRNPTEGRYERQNLSFWYEVTSPTQEEGISAAG